MSDARYLTVARVVRAHGVKGELSCAIVTDYPERFRKTKRVFLAPGTGRPAGVGKHKQPRASRQGAGAAPTPAVASPDAASAAPKDGPKLVSPDHAPKAPPPVVSIAAPEPREYAVSRARVVTGARGAQLVLQLAGIEDRDAAAALRDWLVQVPENEAWKLPKGQYYWHQIIGLAVRTTDGRHLGTVADILETGANDVYVVAREGDELLLPAIKDVVRSISPEDGEIVVELLPGME